MIEFFSSNWLWFLLLFYVAEKLVKISPAKWDDILVDAVISGIKSIVKGKKK